MSKAVLAGFSVIFILSGASFAKIAEFDTLTAPVPPPAILASEEVSLNQPRPAVMDALREQDDRGLLGRRTETELQGLFGSAGTAGLKVLFLIKDPNQLGGKLNLAEDALQYKVGAGLVVGNIWSVPLVLEAALYLREGAFFGHDPFIGANVNYNIVGSGGKMGGLGAQAYCGFLLNNAATPMNRTGLAIGFGSISIAGGGDSTGLVFSILQPFRL